MKRRRNGDSEFDGDLVDPSLGSAEPPNAAAADAAHASSHSQVFVGGGEREARAYVPPTSLPAIAAPKQTADKVAISSSVDPRRMQTMRLAPGRPRPPLTPEELQEQRPDQLAEDVGAPSSRYPTSGSQSQRSPKSAMAATVVRAPPSAAPPTSGPPTIVWVLAVALAALIGAGTALWLRRSTAAPPQTPAPTAPANR